jgi:hypothetical protein
VGGRGNVFALGEAGFDGSSKCVDPTKPCSRSNAVSVTDVIGIAAQPL